MPNRIDETFSRLKKQERCGFMAYITGGDPDLERCFRVALALANAQIDFLEIGVPFSDPLADGLANQLSAQRALVSGATLPKVLALVSRLRKETAVPIILYSYLNPILQYSFERFDQHASAAGVDGLLLLDLPPDEGLVREHSSRFLHRIRLVAPTTSEDRLAKITGQASGFIYYISREGVTGERADLAPALEEQVKKIRRHTRLPVAVGFGISTPDQVRQVSQLCDAVVVGSAIVNRIATFSQEPDLEQRVAHFVEPLVEAAHGLRQANGLTQ
jgi:tryptophan synthase alpha chain